MNLSMVVDSPAKPFRIAIIFGRYVRSSCLGCSFVYYPIDCHWFDIDASGGRV